MILDRIAFYRYILETSGVLSMVAKYMRGGEYRIFDVFNPHYPVSNQKNHSNFCSEENYV